MKYFLTFVMLYGIMGCNKKDKYSPESLEDRIERIEARFSRQEMKMVAYDDGLVMLKEELKDQRDKLNIESKLQDRMMKDLSDVILYLDIKRKQERNTR